MVYELHEDIYAATVETVVEWSIWTTDCGDDLGPFTIPMQHVAVHDPLQQVDLLYV